MNRKLKETNVIGPKGDLLISPGLKVTHRGSGLQYTVDDVTRDKDGELFVLLNLPEEPWVEPARTSGVINQSPRSGRVMYEYDVNPDASFFVPDEEGDVEPDKLAVSQKEFEKNYEVK